MSNPSTHSLEVLLQRKGWVRALARGLVADEHLAEDLAQDAAVAAIEARVPPSRPGPWLRGILRNLAANRKRRSARHAETETRAARSEAVPSAAEGAAFVEQQRILAEAVLALDPPFRDVVLLRFYEDLPQREIAKRLAIPKATVHSRLTRALLRLKGKLDAVHQGDRRAWVRALAPTALRSGSGGRLLFGLWILKKVPVTAAAVLIAVLASTAWLLIGNAAPDTPPGTDVLSEPLASPVAAVDEEPDPSPPMPRTPIAPDGAGTLRIQVVDATTREPVPTAEVRLLDQIPIPSAAVEHYRREVWLRRASFEDFYALGHHRPLEEDGTFLLERPGGQALLARDDERIGLLALRGDETDPVPLELWPLHRVVVRVVDELGRAVAGVPVGADPSGGLLRDTLPETGSVELHWSAAYPRQKDRIRPEVFLAFPLVGSVRVPLDRTPDGPGEIALALPPVGRVHVSVTMGGKPVPDGTLIFLSRRGTYRMAVPGGHSGPFVAETRDSIAEFWPVGVGTELEAYILPWNQGPRFFVGGPGPATRDETVTLRLDVHAQEFPIVGRVVAEDGTPPTDPLIGAVLMDGEEVPVTFDLELDGEGRFSHRFQLAVGTADRGRFQIYTGGRRRVDVALPHPGEDGSIDVGELDLQAPRLQGIVVDGLGQPVTGGSVQMVEPSTRISTGWLSLDSSSRIDERGRIAFFDDLPEGEAWFQVQPTSELMYHEAVPWNQGASEVRLVVQPAGVLAGRIALPPGLSGEPLDVIAWREPGADGETRGRPRAPYFMSALGTDGGFRFPSLASASYTLGVYVSGEHLKPPLARIDGIQVAPGMVTEDPRLSPLDLSTALRVLDLRVRDDHGVSIQARATVYVNDARKVGDTWSFNSTDTPIFVPRSEILRRIQVRADGYFPVTLGPVEGSQEVILSRGLPVTVRVHGAPPLLDPHSLVAILEAEGAPLRRARFTTLGPDSGSLDVPGRIELGVPEAGPYRLRLGVKQDLGGYVRFEDVTPPGVPTVQVTEGQPAELDVTLDAAAVHRAVQRLRDGR